MFKNWLQVKSITKEQFDAMTTDKQAELQGEYLEHLETEIGKKAASDDVSALKAQIDELKANSDVAAVKTAIVGLEGQIEALKEKPAADITPKTFEQHIESVIKESKEDIEKFANGEKQKISIKSPVTIGTNNTINAETSASHFLTTSFTGIYSLIRKRILTYLSNVSVGTISNQHATWVEELDEQGAPIFLGEGGTKPQTSVRHEEREKKVTKVAAYVKVTKEMLADLPQLIAYIQSNLMRRIDIVTETGLFSGDGIGNNLSGLVGYATAFSGGGLTTTSATAADVFRALALQVEVAFGVATAVFVRPQILAEMDVEKDADGRYIMPPFRNPATGQEVAGIRLIPTMGLPSGTDFVGGDLSVVQVRFREGMTIEMDREKDDFTKNLYTILAEQRLVQFVSANDTQVLVKGTMAAAKAAITVS